VNANSIGANQLIRGIWKKKSLTPIMKKALIFLFILFTFSQLGYGQSDVYEELKATYDQLRKAGKNDSSLVVVKKMNAWALQFETDTSLRYAVSLRNLGDSFRRMSRNDSALYYWNKSLEVLKNQQRAESLAAANCLHVLGNFYENLGKYSSAEPYYKRVLEIRRKILVEENPNIAISLNNLGRLNYYLGNYLASENYFKQGLEIRRKIDGEESSNYASSLNDLGNLYLAKEDFKSAETLLKQALEITRKIDGDESSNYAMGLTNLANLYYEMGKYNFAKVNYSQALNIYKKTLGEEDPDYLSTLNNSGVLYKEMGDYKAAESCYIQAMEIRKKILTEEHPDYAGSLTNLGSLYLKMGNYEGADTLYKQALGIYKREKNRNFDIILNNLGAFYLITKKYKSAEPYLKEALEIRRKIDGEESSNYASSLNNLGRLYKGMGDYIAAEPYYKQALEIKRKAVGEENLDFANSLNSLGILYLNMGDYIAAEPYFKQALEIGKKSLGEEHPDYISTEVSFAYLLSKTNREREAYRILNQNFSKIAKQVANNFEWLTDNQKEAYWKKESSFYTNLSFFANEVVQKVPEVAGLNYNGSLLTKSKLLEAQITKNDFYIEKNELWEELGYRNRLLAKLESEGSLEKSRLEKLNFEVDSLDKRLTLSWPEYSQQKKNLQITWNQVQQNLEEGEAAIEFVRFENKSDSLIYYNALVLKKGDSYPQLIKLCAEQDLQFVSPERGFSEYYSLVWQPLEGALQGINTIYYAPTGELYNVPFHAIYVPKEVEEKIVPKKINPGGNKSYTELSKADQLPDYLMDRYTLHQLTSTRYLAMGLKQKAQEPIGTTLALVGAVNFDYLPGSIDKPRKNKNEETDIRGSGYKGKPLEYLGGTKKEVDAIYRQVSKAGWQTTVFIGNNATKEEIIKLEGKESKEILHLATHGYAFPENDFQDTTISQNSLKYNYRHSTNPMVRSGLILAGGNWAWTGSDTLSKGGAGNGILTALEVSQLNLKKTKLVVLSACETGLGKIEGNEGTFGLKRGFKLAGVEQLIVSLWNIPDESTQELMALFYSDLTHTKNPTLSFQKAQQAMREKYPTSPYYWAGFVMVR
jgi:CHAT domain-containing protein/Tfp pilus assembly protein PilF